MLATRVPAALVTYRLLVTEYPQHPEAEEAWWKLGEMYFDLKRYALAAVAFERLATGFPSTRHEAWWQAGQIYDRRLDDAARAVAAYQRVPASSSRYQDAQKRISRLAR
jgi:TolA-binding protein